VPDLDLFVIGGGSGGVSCARRAAAHGARVALAEASRVGGTCVVRGCVPKKLMHYAARFGEQLEDARAYGWPVERPTHDWDALIAARNNEIARLEGIYRKMLESAGVRLIEGPAAVEGRSGDAFIVQAAGEEVSAARVLIATGARPQLVEVPGIEHAITSDQVLEGSLPRPERVVIVGAGYIGVEVACFLSGLGIEATMVLRRDLPLRGFDEDLRSHLADEIEKRGVRLRPGTTVRQIVREGDGLLVATDSGMIEADAVVYATGRTPRANTGGIGLGALGVRRDTLGAIHVDVTYESVVPGLLAVGDCSDHAGNGLDSGAHDLTPVAIAEGRALAERLFNANPQTVRYDAVPTAVFSQPEAAAVGMSEERARALGHEVQIFRTVFRPMLHTLTGRDTRTMMKVVVDRGTDAVLGCHMVGDDAAEIVQGLAVALTVGVTKAELDATMALHPTAAEELVTLRQPLDRE
jgi:glutathione reductase (NADPH)